MRATASDADPEPAQVPANTVTPFYVAMISAFVGKHWFVSGTVSRARKAASR